MGASAQDRPVLSAHRYPGGLADDLSWRADHMRRLHLPARSGIARPQNLGRCLLRGDAWVFGPETPYEMLGDVGNVVFPCGQTIGPDGDTINLYYGGADTCMALATGSIRGIAGLAAQARNQALEPQ